MNKQEHLLKIDSFKEISTNLKLEIQHEQQQGNEINLPNLYKEFYFNQMNLDYENGDGTGTTGYGYGQS